MQYRKLHSPLQSLVHRSLFQPKISISDKGNQRKPSEDHVKTEPTPPASPGSWCDPMSQLIFFQAAHLAEGLKPLSLNNLISME